MAARREPESAANRTTMDLEGDRAIVITRTFDAPPAIVFDAWTNAELVKRWWAPRSLGVSMTGCQAEVRVGGAYRYVLRRDTGEEMAFSGRYTEIAAPTRLVYTQVFEPMAHVGEAIVTVTFEAQPGDTGKTRLVSREVYPSKQARAGVIASGMEHGMRETMEQLEALLATLR